jgi:hypothetical protein
MQPLALMLIALIAVGAAAFVARPLLRPPQPRRVEPEQGSGSTSLLERRDRALAALKELEFDHRTGKLADSDYRALLGPLRREAAEALRLLGQREAAASPRAATRRKRTVLTR